MKRKEKGTYGYTRSEKGRRAVIALIMLAIPIAIYFSAMHILGTNRNIMTIVAVLGIIPAARFVVSWIMIMLVKDGSREAVEVTEKYASELVRGYELTVTSYDGRMPLDAVVICGNEVIACSLQGQKELIGGMQTHITKILNSNNYFNTNVKIFQDLKHYEDRIRKVAASPETYREGISFRPDERYPDLSRDELILHTIKAISL